MPFSEHISVCSITDFSCFSIGECFANIHYTQELTHQPVILPHASNTYHEHAEVWGVPCHSKHRRFEIFLVPGQIDEGNHLQHSNNFPNNITYYACQKYQLTQIYYIPLFPVFKNTAFSEDLPSCTYICG